MQNKFKYILITILLLSSFSLAEGERDFLYSDAYFDYLIECAQEEKNEELEKEKQKQQEEIKEIVVEEIKTDLKEDIISSEFEPFQLQIQAFESIDPYKESYKKESQKTEIELAKNLNIIQDTQKGWSKNSFDYFKIITGVEYNPTNPFKISFGMETYTTEYFQQWNNRKFYFNPSLTFSDKLSLSFYSNLNPQTRATYHNLGFSISPFKSKAMDFRLYAATDRTQSGAHTESAGLSTNFYFY